MKNWINLARFNNMMDWMFAQSILESNEIDFIVQNQHTYSLDPLSTEYSDMVIIIVPINQYEEAKKILKEYEYDKYLIEE